MLKNRKVQRGLVVAAVLALIWIAWSTLAVVYFDHEWFGSVRAGVVWRQRIWSKAVLGFLGCAWIAVAVGAQLRVAHATTDDTARNLFANRYRRYVGRWDLPLKIGVVAYAVWRFGVPFAERWGQWMLFRHAADNAGTDPVFGRSVGTYLYRAPFLTSVFDIVIAGLFLGLAMAAATYLVNGGVKVRGVFPVGLNPAAARNLGVSAGLLMIVYAVKAMTVGRIWLVETKSPLFTGAGWVDANVRSPSYLFGGIALVAAGALVIFGATRARWKLVAATLGATGVVAAGLVAVVPRIAQRTLVDPERAVREATYVTANRDATLDAFGLSEEFSSYSPDKSVAPKNSAAAATASLSRAPIFDPALVRPTIQTLRGKQNFTVGSVSIDRYPTANGTRSVMLAPQMVDRAKLSGSWEDAHVVYTHGYGMEAAWADSATEAGRPQSIDLSSGGTTPSLRLSNPSMYYGPGLEGWYAVVGTNREEMGGRDYAGAADTGVGLGSLFGRLVAATKYQDPALVLSSYITEDSLVLDRRSPNERLASIAPFLDLAAPPTPVIADGRVVWMADLLTTTAWYPNSQMYTINVEAGPKTVNYAKASVKATVDAADGTVHLYRLDRSTGDISKGGDPLLDVWQKAFPGLIEPQSEMPDVIAEHLLYPSTLLSLQAQILGHYRISNPSELVDGSRDWAVAPNPGRAVASPGTGTMTPVSAFLPAGNDAAPAFNETLPMVPGAGGGTRPRTAALLTASQDGSTYGDLALEEFPASASGGGTVDSPVAIQRTIESDARISWQLTQLNQSGSAVEFGQLVMVPAEGTAIAIRPIYIRGTGADGFQRLLGVAVVRDGTAVLAPDIGQGLAALDNPKLAAELAKSLLPETGNTSASTSTKPGLSTDDG